MTFRESATATAPGGIGNLGPGLDILGCALSGPADSVRAEWGDEPGISIADAGHPELPADPDRHAAGIAARAVVRAATSLGTTAPSRGIRLTVVKGLPLSAGRGGSAASAVAGAAAVNALLGEPLSRLALLQAALEAESTVAGHHLDNLAPSLVGGIVLVRSVDPIELIPLPVPPNLRFVIASPAQRLRTADARAVLPTNVPRATALHQMAVVATMVSALHRGDVRLFGAAIDDRIAEPARAALLPGFIEAKRAALAAGAYGASISGAGPSAFAVVDDTNTGAQVIEAMRAAYQGAGVEADVQLASVDTRGVRVRFGARTTRGRTSAQGPNAS